MLPNAGDARADPRDLRRRLDAERAAVEHWRRVARQKEEQLAALNRRPAVRALLAGERRLTPVVWRAGSALRRLRMGCERLALVAGALRRAGRRRSARGPVAREPLAPATARQMALCYAIPRRESRCH
jgi:hypothetical protein